ncbi:MAG: nucleotidyltransferase family protein [bacterium]|nr:nucleotidyltransferase family protein [bacterium]
MARHSRSPRAGDDAIILAGGLGKRLRGVLGDLPKPMLPVLGRPFLEWVLLSLRNAGFESFVISTGYRREAIRGHFGDGAGWGVRIRYAEEERPLGTAGAVRNAIGRVRTDDILVANGDSLCLCDHAAFRRFHEERGAAATICCVKAADPSRYGSVRFDRRGMVEQFAEKGAGGGAGWINAGMCRMKRDVVRGFEHRIPLSLEEDVFPRLAGAGLHAYRSRGDFIDIGTRESLARAAGFLVAHRLADRAPAGGGAP